MREHIFEPEEQQHVPTHSPRRRAGQRRTGWRRRGWIGAGLILLCLLPFLWQAGRIGLQLQAAYRSGQQFATFARGDLTPEQYAMAATALAESSTALTAAEANFGFFAPLLHNLRWLPLVGSDLAALPPLFAAGQQLSEIGVSAFALAEPILLAPAGSSPLTQLPALYATAEPELARLRVEMEGVTATLAEIEAAALSPLLREPVQQLQSAVGLLAPGLQLSGHLPALLGMGEARTYLILAQNNHELRATGGFLTAVGRLSLLDGRVVGLEFVDSYDASISRTDVTVPQAPLPVRRHMGIEIMLLRDANWSPDFPTTAQIMRTIYTQQTGQSVDGVIALDLHAVERFVSALEPLQLAGVDAPLTGATVIEQLAAFWAAPLDSDVSLAGGDAAWWKQRKDFIPKLANAMLTRVQRGQFDYLQMLSTLQGALETRAVQLWFANPEIAASLATVGWDGGLRPPPDGDFLAIVDTNFGYNKVNAVIEETVSYQVAWPDEDEAAAAAVATLTLIYRHPVERSDYLCDQTPRYAGSYAEMMARCYFNYLRVYVPPGSELLGVDGLQPETVVSQRGDGGSQLFAGYFVLKPETEQTVVLQYRLPSSITPETYQLTVRRQAGTDPLPFQVQVDKQFTATTIERGTFHWP